MNRYRWDIESCGTDMEIPGPHTYTWPDHVHVKPKDPTPYHFYCRSAKHWNYVPKVSFIEATKQGTAVEPVYFFTSPTGSLKWKSFAHYKRTSTYPKGNLAVCGYVTSNPKYCSLVYTNGAIAWSGSGFGPIDGPFTGLPLLYSQNDVVPTPANLNAYITRSLECMLPSIKPELSLLNSLIELKDWRTFPRTISNVANMLPRGRQTLRRILRGAADSYLQGSFNLLPLLSDITGIQSAIRNTDIQLQNLMKRQFTLQKRHFTASMHNEFPNSDSWGPQRPSFNVPQGHPTIAGGPRDHRIVQYDKRAFHAEIMYNYWYPKYQLEHARMRALLDSFGVNLNPAIIWNAIPWSFVVDWVFGVSRWLDQFKSTNMEPVCLIHRYLCTTNTRRTTYCYNNVTSVNSHRGSDSVLSASHIEHAYKRMVGIPSLYQAIQSTGLNPKEFSLASALAFLRWDRS